MYGNDILHIENKLYKTIKLYYVQNIMFMSFNIPIENGITIKTIIGICINNIQQLHKIFFPLLVNG